MRPTRSPFLGKNISGTRVEMESQSRYSLTGPLIASGGLNLPSGRKRGQSRNSYPAFNFLFQNIDRLSPAIMLAT